METVRNTSGKIYAKTNTANVVKLLVSISCILIVMVCGVCVFAIFWRVPLSGSHLNQSGEFYYSLTGDSVKFETYLGRSATEFVIPEFVLHAGTKYKITSISSNAFTNKNNLKKITIPDSVTKIDSSSDAKVGAFSGCLNLSEIVWGNSLSHIGDYAFYNCIGLKNLTIPSNIQVISNYAFENCYALESLELIGNTIIQNDAFKGCQNINKLILGEEVGLGLNIEAFAPLNNLVNFIVEGANLFYKVVDNCLLSADGQSLFIGGKSQNIPTGVTKISDYAFADRYTSNDIFLDSTIIEVGKNSFKEGVIYTNSISVPTGWKTLLTINLDATKIDFYRNFDTDDAEMISWYIYSGNNTSIFPSFEELFNVTPEGYEFLKWEQDIKGYKASYVTKLSLNQKLNEYKSIILSNGEDYKLDNFEIFSNKYLAAENISKNIKSTQTEIDDALNDLVSAYSNLVRLTPDFAELNAMLGLCNIILNNPNERIKYKIEVWEDFKAVCFNAEKVKSNTESTVAEIKNAISNLANQYNKLKNLNDTSILESTDWKIGLMNLIAVSNEMVQTDYETANWSNFIMQLSFAKGALNNPDTSNAEGKTAWENLRVAFESVISKPDNLNALVSECNILLKDEYTPESWAVFETLLIKAKGITTTNTSIVRKNLINAKTNLIPLQENVEELEELIIKFKDYNKSDYLGDWQRFQNALLSAQNKPWKNIEVGGILKELKESYAGLTGKIADLGKLTVWISVCDLLNSGDYTLASWSNMISKLNSAKEINNGSPASQVELALSNLQNAYTGLELLPQSEVKPNIFLSVGTAAYFIIAAILFTGAMVSLSFAYSLKKSFKRK